MPVTIDWDNDEHTVLLMTFSGRWTWDEVYAASDHSNRTLISTVNHEVHILLDFRQSTGLPSLALSNTRTLLNTRSNQVDRVIFVGASTTIMTLWKAFAQAFSKLAHNNRFAFVKTMEEARDLIVQKTI